MSSSAPHVDLPSQAGRIAIVTGSNRGLGFQIAAALAAAGAQVVLACRDMAKAQRAAELLGRTRVEPMLLDVASLASIREFAATFNARYPRLDLLFHNAAAIMVPQGRTQDGFELHLGSNHLGPFALTGLLLDRVNAAPAARIINTGSLAHRMTAGLDPEDPALLARPYKPMDAYGRSKLAALLFTFELDRRLRLAGSATRAFAAHPGYAATNLDLGGFWLRLATKLIAQPAAAGAEPALFAATAPGLGGGEYIGPGGLRELRGRPKLVERSDAARDPVLARRLWEMSEQLTGVRYLDR